MMYFLKLQDEVNYRSNCLSKIFVQKVLYTEY